MYQLITITDEQGVQAWLGQNSSTQKPAPNKPIPYRIYQKTSDNTWHLLGASEPIPDGVQINYLTESQWVNFLDCFKPQMASDLAPGDSKRVLQDKVTREAMQALADMLSGLKKHVNKKHQGNGEGGEGADEASSPEDPQSKALFDKMSQAAATAFLAARSGDVPDGSLRMRRQMQKQIQEVGKQLEQQLTKQQCDELESFIEYVNKHKDAHQERLAGTSLFAVSTIIGLCDGAWLGGSLGYGSANLFGATATSATYASIGASAGLMGVLPGALCGAMAAGLYISRAKAQYKEDHGNEPTGQDLKNIEFDGKTLGFKIFGAMTGWSVSAAIIQAIIKYTLFTNPHGILANVLVAVAAGLGEAFGVCVAYHLREKEKFKLIYTNDDGVLDVAAFNAAWDAHTSKGYWAGMLVLGLTSFLAGAAWQFISVYIPEPLQLGVKHTFAEIGKAIVAALVIGGIFFAGLWKMEKAETGISKSPEVELPERDAEGRGDAKALEVPSPVSTEDTVWGRMATGLGTADQSDGDGPNLADGESPKGSFFQIAKKVG